MNWKQTAIAAATVLSVVGLTAYAQDSLQPVHGYQGMMGGGYSQGYGPGYGSGYGSGYRGGYHMGPGMAMGGFELGAINRLDLNDQQRSQIVKIEDDLRKKNWDVMGKMQDEMTKLRDATWSSGKRDRGAILTANKRMTDLRQQLLENSLDATDKAEALLTPQQREQFKRLAQSWFDNNSN